MAANVFAAVLRRSRAEGTDRNVLLALAECAGRDGVTWVRIGEGKDDEDGTICRLARVSKSTAIRAIAFLRDELEEIQTVRVRRGRSFTTVYRVIRGADAVNYEALAKIGIDLPHRFEEKPVIHGVSLTPSLEQSEETQAPSRLEKEGSVHGVRLTPSTETADKDSRCQIEGVHGVKSAAFTVSIPRARPMVLEPTANQLPEPTAADLKTEGLEHPAAAERALTDHEISELVLAIPGADSGSPRVVIPIAFGLPRGIVEGVIDRVAQRRGGVGLLVDLLRIVRAERTAMLRAQLNAELARGVRQSSRPITTAEALKADDPRRYVRIMAKALPPDMMRQALEGCEDVEALMTLHEAIVAGEEHEDRLGTDEQERARWVEAKATDISFPIDEIHVVIDSWDRVDDIERDELHELADQRRLRPKSRAA